MTKKTNKKVTIPGLFKKKKSGEKITVLTAYDYPTGKILDQAGIDIILVGDSLGMVVLGHENTIPVTMDNMLYHTQAVSRGVENALVVGDMPYFSYHLSVEQTVLNASRFLKEAGAQAVKIEGSSKKRLHLIETMVEAEIPVMGHVGLTPQSICHLGRFQVQGNEKQQAEQILQGAKNLENAGAFSVVLECVPLELARIITESLTIPTIGIGAGPFCDGQVLVFHDLVGYANGYLPKFVKPYLALHDVIQGAVLEYIQDVKNASFPADQHSFHMKNKTDLDDLK